MSISYAKINSDIEFGIKEIENIEKKEGNELGKDIKKLFVDTTCIIQDSDENQWIYSPVTDRYYLYYNKEKKSYTMTCYPTAGSIINPSCKLGLRLYEKPSAGSDTIKRFSMDESIQVTSHFKVDENGTIWIYSVALDDRKNPKEITDGWIIYKNNRNNFVNILFRNNMENVTTNGELDIDKVKKFGSILFNLKNSYLYFGRNYLQYFSKESTKNFKIQVPIGLSTGDNTISTIDYMDEGKYSVSSSKRKKRSNWSNDANPKNDNFGLKTKFGNVSDVTHHRPIIVQNGRSFPSTKSTKSPYVYDYYMDYSGDNIFNGNLDSTMDSDLLNDMKKLYKDINFDTKSRDDLYEKLFTRYNRFKLAMPDDGLSRGFGHIFFTKPDCNVYGESGRVLNDKVKANANFQYAYCHRKRLLDCLSQNGSANDFMLFLSNKAEEFSLNDESLVTDTQGQTFKKNQIAFGKSNTESKANGEFSIKYTDNRDLDIFHLHKLWTDYISNVYLGYWYPKKEYLWQKILDYACSCYYILTAEDGETILFWSKYYGVFPVNVPSSSYSWSKGNVITSPEPSITYQYSLKEDFNPMALIEFNLNSKVSGSTKYLRTYDPKLGGSGYTWGGSPFIEVVKGKDGDSDYYFKLKFKAHAD